MGIGSSFPRTPCSKASRISKRIFSTALAPICTAASLKSGYPSIHLRRYTLRTDGFVSVHGPYKGGKLVTKPFTFLGGYLVLNYATSAAGGMRVEIQFADGKPIEGFGLKDCKEIIGDRAAQVVH